MNSILRLLCLAVLLGILIFSFAACSTDPVTGERRLHGSITACYENACVTYDPHRPVPMPVPARSAPVPRFEPRPEPLPLPFFAPLPQTVTVKDSGK